MSTAKPISGDRRTVGFAPLNPPYSVPSQNQLGLGHQRDEATLGITWFAQDALGELVHFEAPENGAGVTKDSSYGEVESVKAVSELISPLSGEVLEVNQKVVDAPETVQAKCETERRAGEDAKRFTVMALARGPVRIERSGRDRYGRTLAHVWIGNLDLARMLISAGHGREYHGERRRPWC